MNRFLTSPAQLVLLGLLVTSCNTADPDFSAPTILERITFSASRQYPEGITFSSRLDKFLVSSITQGKVGTVDQNGRYEDFIKDDPMLISAIGMKIWGNQLYVCNGDQGVSVKSTDKTALKTAGLFIYDLTTGQNIRHIDLAALVPGVNHFANDLAFDPEGNAYVTDSFAPIIYKVPADANQLAFKFVESPLFTGTGVNLNGIVYHPEKFLIVSKANEGKLFKIDLATSTITEITGVNLPSGDGMLLFNNDLYVVNNRKRVTQLRSTDSWKTATIVKSDSLGYDQATTNVLVGDQIYTLNARIGEVSAAVAAKNPAQLQASEYSIQQFK
ncbi:gluconolaconase [Spirosoma sp. BT702]|uniref:Gluconolaconase n=1 Tax=Spirosoma profusum TaxID=2771354 RepID=A0A926XY58_9BACT|nr:gluconolaconase [Spirosoma profusum]MBD2702256.1 gluconolaconase [Spirosoma profusum]